MNREKELKLIKKFSNELKVATNGRKIFVNIEAGYIWKLLLIEKYKSMIEEIAGVKSIEILPFKENVETELYTFNGQASIRVKKPWA